MTASLSDVTEAVKRANSAYNEMLDVRAKSRDGSRKVRAAEGAWHEALAARDEALREHYGADAKVSASLKQFYEDTLTPRRNRRRPSAS